MRRIFERSVLLSGVVLILNSVSADANTISPNFVSFTAGTSITYNADLASGQMHAGDGFTIYDIWEYGGIDSIVSAYGWTVTAQAVGTPLATPGTLTTDYVSATNVTFQYDGVLGSIETAGQLDLGLFTLLTGSTVEGVDEWLSNDHLYTEGGSTGDGAEAPIQQAFITVPGNVPDGGSTAVLLGSVLCAFGMLRRRFGNG
ncbi:MAG: VPDSG-CTERM sorting domain-containing protein [Bryobacterales bacterium]